LKLNDMFRSKKKAQSKEHKCSFKEITE
jgi:hypothetical protein